MNRTLLAVAVAAIAAGAPQTADASVSINFDSGTQNQLVGADFAALGVTFSNARYSFTALPGQSAPFTITAPGTSIFGPSNAIVAVFNADVASVTLHEGSRILRRQARAGSRCGFGGRPGCGHGHGRNCRVGA